MPSAWGGGQGVEVGRGWRGRREDSSRSVQLLTCITGLHIHRTLWNLPRTEIFIFISWSPSHFSPNVILSKQHHHSPSYSGQNPGKPSWSFSSTYYLPSITKHCRLFLQHIPVPLGFSTVPVLVSALDCHLVSTAGILLVPSVPPAFLHPCCG